MVLRVPSPVPSKEAASIEGGSFEGGNLEDGGTCEGGCLEGSTLEDGSLEGGRSNSQTWGSGFCSGSPRRRDYQHIRPTQAAV